MLGQLANKTLQSDEGTVLHRMSVFTQAWMCLQNISPTFIEIYCIMQYSSIALSKAIVLSCHVDINFFSTKNSQTLVTVLRLCGKSWYFPVGVLSQLSPFHVIVFNVSFMSFYIVFFKINCPTTFSSNQNNALMYSAPKYTISCRVVFLIADIFLLEHVD